ncbi:hypothetical protein [Kitasatospora indigofera]|uniref:hypothetical protein n=1 Tax=Kitasatospora indigofera TaxID=67307 RepID=UPI0033ACB075
MSQTAHDVLLALLRDSEERPDEPSSERSRDEDWEAHMDEIAARARHELAQAQTAAEPPPPTDPNQEASGSAATLAATPIGIITSGALMAILAHDITATPVILTATAIGAIGAYTWPKRHVLAISGHRERVPLRLSHGLPVRR